MWWNSLHTYIFKNRILYATVIQKVQLIAVGTPPPCTVVILVSKRTTGREQTANSDVFVATLNILPFWHFYLCLIMKRKVSCLLFNVWFPSAVCKNTKPRSVCTLHAANVPPPYKGSNKCADGTLDWHYSMMYIRGTHTHLQGKSAIEHTYTHIHLWVQQYSRKQKL